MRGLVALAVVALTGCSFVGASVPDHPPPPEHCPEGVVILDVAGTGLFLVPGTVMFVEGLLGKDDTDHPSGTGLVLLSMPMLAVGALYLTSTMYGFHEHGRCVGMKAAVSQ